MRLILTTAIVGLLSAMPALADQSGASFNGFTYQYTVLETPNGTGAAFMMQIQEGDAVQHFSKVCAIKDKPACQNIYQLVGTYRIDGTQFRNPNCGKGNTCVYTIYPDRISVELLSPRGETLPSRILFKRVY